MVVNCSFETERLIVDDWSRLLTGHVAEELRNRFVVSLLTAPVTRDLPAEWQGPYEIKRAASWFAERQSESTVLLIANRYDSSPLGLLIMSEDGPGKQGRDIRLGYLIVESAWGTGLATEVVAGVTEWCRADGTIRSLIGGVDDRNTASARVLEKNGFVPDANDSEDRATGVEYTLTFSA